MIMAHKKEKERSPCMLKNVIIYIILDTLLKSAC